MEMTRRKSLDHSDHAAWIIAETARPQRSSHSTLMARMTEPNPSLNSQYARQTRPLRPETRSPELYSRRTPPIADTKMDQRLLPCPTTRAATSSLVPSLSLAHRKGEGKTSAPSTAQPKDDPEASP